MSYRLSAAVDAAGFDWAALSWLVHQADMRGDMTRGDGYRQAMIWKEGESGERER